MDHWYDWLTHGRQGGAQPSKCLVERLEYYRDRVLDGAKLAEGMTLVDMGAGDGLIGLGAIARIGPSLKVILADISAPLLRHTEEIAIQKGVREQCTFVEGPAEKCSGVATACADAVTSRSMLIYIQAKMDAIAEFHRILKPGGRVSIAEPIYRDQAIGLVAMGNHLKSQPESPQTLDLRLALRWSAAHLPSTMEEINQNPLTNFSEHDLVTLFQRVGFADVHLEMHIDVHKLENESWETLLNSSALPGLPTLGEILATRFTEEERTRFETTQRPLIEKGQAIYRTAMAYLTAVKPTEP
jgi:ubiquinone/menaquinone biosynthesis C-methylase UbiE